MPSNVVDVSSFSSELGTILSRYSKDISNETELWLKNTAQKTARNVKRFSMSAGFKPDAKYANGWVAKKVDGKWVVHNKSKPYLAHLLENGHDIVRNGVKVGESPAFPHISTAEKEIEGMIQELEKNLGGIK